ncbi:MAG: FAD-dependent oxidoreductase [Hyphomicrobiaceae bacterium]|nr:FAD-binding oxidoreductase [Hyphomicrobiaceae bacterium]
MTDTPITTAASLWASVTRPADSYTPLKGAKSVDCVVIGAGLTGLTAAHHLQKSGVTTLLIEAAEPGWGASGRSNGQIIPALNYDDLDELKNKHRAAGERFIALVRNSATTTFDLIRREGIDAEVEITGWIEAAVSGNDLRALERRHTQWQKHGAKSELLSRDDVAKKTGSTTWAGGWHLPLGGTVNPLALVRGLAAAFVSAGGVIHNHTTALSFGRAGTRWVTTTPQGRVDSRALILASNAYTDQFSKRLEPTLAREFVPVTAWQMATNPLNEQQRIGILPSRAAITETATPLSHLRIDARQRLIIGGTGQLDANNRLQAVARTRLHQLVPSLAKSDPLKFEYQWSGITSQTSDRLPLVHTLGPDGVAWLGCNGRGLALAASVGHELARAITGTPQTDLALPFTEPKPISFHAIKRHGGITNAIKAHLFTKSA